MSFSNETTENITVYGLPVTDGEQLIRTIHSMSAQQKDDLIRQIREPNIHRFSWEHSEENELLRRSILEAHGEQKQPLSEDERKIISLTIHDNGLGWTNVYSTDIALAIKTNDIMIMRLLIKEFFKKYEDNWNDIWDWDRGISVARKNECSKEMCIAVYDEYSRTRKLATRSLYYVIGRGYRKGASLEIRYFLERGASSQTISCSSLCWLLEFIAVEYEEEIKETMASLETLIEMRPNAMTRLFTGNISSGADKGDNGDEIYFNHRYFDLIYLIWKASKQFISLFLRIPGRRNFILNHMLWNALLKSLLYWPCWTEFPEPRPNLLWVQEEKCRRAWASESSARPQKQIWDAAYEEKVEFLLENGARLSEKSRRFFSDEFQKGNMPQDAALLLKKYGYHL